MNKSCSFTRSFTPAPTSTITPRVHDQELASEPETRDPSPQSAGSTTPEWWAVHFGHEG